MWLGNDFKEREFLNAKKYFEKSFPSELTMELHETYALFLHQFLLTAQI